MAIVKNTFLMPALKLDDQKFEFVFLLDNSTSMRGRRTDLELAKTALNVRKNSRNHFLFMNDLEKPYTLIHSSANLNSAYLALTSGYMLLQYHHIQFELLPSIL
jgi:hypothetical protein